MPARALCLASFLATACGGGDGPSGGGESAAKAAKIWESRCVTCHGATGHGDGPGSVALSPKPRSFADTKWQAETTDERIGRAIVEGGAAVGLNPAMAPNPDLAESPEVVAELVRIVRGFRR
jgi:cytochrome c553